MAQRVTTTIVNNGPTRRLLYLLPNGPVVESGGSVVISGLLEEQLALASLEGLIDLFLAEQDANLITVTYLVSGSGGGGGTPGAPVDSVQFNNAGSFGGSSDLLWNDSTKLLAVGGTVQNDLTQFVEAAAPSTPASGLVSLYAKTDGDLYYKDDTGAESRVATGTIGPGTAGFIPVFTGASTLGNSGIQEVGGGEYSFSNGGAAISLSTAAATTARTIYLADRTQTYGTALVDDVTADVMWRTSTSATKALVLQASPSQTAPIFEIQDEDGLASVRSDASPTLSVLYLTARDGQTDAMLECNVSDTGVVLTRVFAPTGTAYATQAWYNESFQPRVQTRQEMLSESSNQIGGFLFVGNAVQTSNAGFTDHQVMGLNHSYTSADFADGVQPVGLYTITGVSLSAARATSRLYGHNLIANLDGDQNFNRVVGVNATAQNSSTAGTLADMRSFYASTRNNSSSASATTAGYGYYSLPWFTGSNSTTTFYDYFAASMLRTSSGTAVSHSHFAGAAFDASVTNWTGLLLGTSTVPSGHYAIYSTAGATALLGSENVAQFLVRAHSTQTANIAEFQYTTNTHDKVSVLASGNLEGAYGTGFSTKSWVLVTAQFVPSLRFNSLGFVGWSSGSDVGTPDTGFARSAAQEVQLISGNGSTTASCLRLHAGGRIYANAATNPVFSSGSVTSNVVTINTSGFVSLSPGQIITVTGSTGVNVDGTFTVLTCNNFSFTYAKTIGNGTVTAATITINPVLKVGAAPPTVMGTPTTHISAWSSTMSALTLSAAAGASRAVFEVTDSTAAIGMDVNQYGSTSWYIGGAGKIAVNPAGGDTTLALSVANTHGIGWDSSSNTNNNTPDAGLARSSAAIIRFTNGVTSGDGGWLAGRGSLIDGTTDEIQLRIQGHSTQTSDLFVVEKSNGDDLFTVTNGGAATFYTYSNTTDFWRFAAAQGRLSYTKTTVGEALAIVGDDGGGSSPAAIRLAANSYFTWQSANRVDTGSPDTGLLRAAAGIVQFSTGDSGNGGWQVGGARATVAGSSWAAAADTTGVAFVLRGQNGGTASAAANGRAGSLLQMVTGSGSNGGSGTTNGGAGGDFLIVTGPGGNQTGGGTSGRGGDFIVQLGGGGSSARGGTMAIQGGAEDLGNLTIGDYYGGLVPPTGVSATLLMGHGVAPSSNVTNAAQMYVADESAGNAAFHFRTESSQIVKLFSDTGWTAATGSPTKGGFDSSSVTLPQLAENVVAIIDLLLANGLAST